MTATIDLREETVVLDASTLARLRIFCVACSKRAEVLWQGDAHFGAHLLHLKCHNEERLILLPQYVVRRSASVGMQHVDLMWSQLSDAGDDADLEALMTSDEQDITKLAERIAICRSVLASRMNGRRE